MHLFSSEFVHNYGTYSFGYCNYCKREETDALADIYAHGYLPYSGSADTWDMFYMARSARVALTSWEPTSENRRVLSKHDMERTVHAKDAYATDEDFYTFCLTYFEQHHGAHTMPRERFEHILKERALTYIVEYRDNGELAGYVFLVADAQMTHVWFYFYAPAYAQSSFGMWVLLNEARVAQDSGKAHFYIGTAYGDKSRYKTNFAHLEFFTGGEWREDKKNEEVKTRIKNDTLKLIDGTDAFKHDKENFFTQ